MWLRTWLTQYSQSGRQTTNTQQPNNVCSTNTQSRECDTSIEIARICKCWHHTRRGYFIFFSIRKCFFFFFVFVHSFCWVQISSLVVVHTTLRILHLRLLLIYLSIENLNNTYYIGYIVVYDVDDTKYINEFTLHRYASHLISSHRSAAALSLTCMCAMVRVCECHDVHWRWYQN